LVTTEAPASVSVLLDTEAAGAICRHMENALVHRTGDVGQLTEHLASLDADRDLLARLRTASLTTVKEITWKAAGRRLLTVYRETIAAYHHSAEGSPDDLAVAGTPNKQGACQTRPGSFAELQCKLIMSSISGI
jgi:hypothetical protein